MTSPGKTPPPRKPNLYSTVREKIPANLIQKEYGLSYGNPCFVIDGHEFTYIDGKWNIDPDYSIIPKSSQENLEKEIVSLREENSFLKVKIEIILCWLAERKCKIGNEKNKLKELECSNTKENSDFEN